MLTVLRVHLPSEIPVVGCEITPYVLLRRPDNSISNDDVPESAPFAGYCMRYRWYRIHSDRKVAFCSVHPTKQATLQCVACEKAKIPLAKSYHCSSRCFADSWHHHRALHEQASSAINESGAVGEELFGRLGGSGSGVLNSGLSGSASNVLGRSSGLNNGCSYPVAAAERSGGETLFEVGHSKTYTPTADDIGHVLKFECVAIDAKTGTPVGTPSTILTSLVIPAPSPSPRRMFQINGLADFDGRSASSGTFTILSYNILSDVYATKELYSYCPSWALSWPYRRQNLFREIVGYHADILCLQEVQGDHFEEFLVPELDKQGYQALYKKKTSEVYTGNPLAVDGCATFFRRDKFSHVKKYEVEFNKAALSLIDAVIAPSHKKAALSRLIKDNIALITVLEAKFSNNGSENSGKRQLLCVANTHINIPQELEDVKLWQVHTLLKGLEKISVSADIPMLVCGDFNSLPGSPSHALLSTGKIDMLLDSSVDPLGILRPTSKLAHRLPLVSAYSAFPRSKGFGHGLDQQRRKIDPITNEPLFTKCTREFVGTLDYIFFTEDSLTVESLLELIDEESLRKDTALPSPEWSSDHMALLAEFRCKPRSRR